MSDGRMTVKLDLRRTTAEKLRAMCHARGETASEIIDRWILQANDRGDIVPVSKPRTKAEDLLADLLSKR